MVDIKKRKPKKTGKPNKPKKRKRNKKNKLNISNTVFVVLSFFVLSFLVYYFVSANKNKIEQELVAISPQPPEPITETRTVPNERQNIENKRNEPVTDTRTQRPINPETSSRPHTPPQPTPVETPPSTPPRTPITPPQNVLSPTRQTPLPVEKTAPQTPVTPAPPTPEPNQNQPIIRTINPNLPKIVIIIDDFGRIGNTLFEKFNSLDKEIAFAILPGLPNSRSHSQRAVAAGREVLIHIPMEPESNEGLEPNTIKTTMTDNEIKSQIESWMYELPLAIGVNNHMGSKATQDERVLYNTMLSLQQNDMFFIDSFTSPNSKVGQVANSLGIKTITRDVFLDVPDNTNRTARQKIDEMKKMTNQDNIVVITHCHTDAKYRQLVFFIERLKAEGYQIIPASTTVK